MVHGSQPAADARISWDVVEEHLDEAEFLFEQWQAAIDSPIYTLDEVVAGPEGRLRAHLDGLAVGGTAVAERLLWPVVSEGSPDAARVSAAAMALAELPDRRWLDATIAGLGTHADAAHRDALAAGLIASERPDVSARVASALDRAPDAEGRAQWLAVLAARGGLVGASIDTLLGDPDPAVRAGAIAAARFTGRAGALRAAESRLADPEPAVVLAALQVGCIAGSMAAWSAALQLATARAAPTELTGRAMLLIALVGEPAHVDALVGCLGDPARARDAIWALGFSGRIAAADALAGLLLDPVLAPLAAEALASIGGLPREDERYWEPALPGEDPDEPRAAVPEDDLPRPDAAQVHAWWTRHRTGFDARVRYHDGTIARGAAYYEVLGRIATRRRHALALEVAIRTRGAQHVPTRSLVGLQRTYLHALHALDDLDGQRAFARIV